MDNRKSSTDAVDAPTGELSYGGGLANPQDMTELATWVDTTFSPDVWAGLFCHRPDHLGTRVEATFGDANATYRAFVALVLKEVPSESNGANAIAQVCNDTTISEGAGTLVRGFATPPTGPVIGILLHRAMGDPDFQNTAATSSNGTIIDSAQSSGGSGRALTTVLYPPGTASPEITTGETIEGIATFVAFEVNVATIIEEV